MRKVPPGGAPIGIHIDQGGALCICVLFDEIKEKDGGTYLIPGSHLNNPPPRYILNNFEKFNNGISIVGGPGDLFFWFSDCWHGRPINSGKKTTCILFVNLESQGRRVDEVTLRAYKKRVQFESLYEKIQDMLNPNQISKSFDLWDNINNWIFRKIGNDPSSLFKKLVYTILLYRTPILRKRIQTKNYIYTRIIPYDNLPIKDLTILNYFRKINKTKLENILKKRLIYLKDKFFGNIMKIKYQ